MESTPRNANAAKLAARRRPWVREMETASDKIAMARSAMKESCQARREVVSSCGRTA
jgi:hypothetical protein